MKFFSRALLLCALVGLAACQSPPAPTGVKIGKPYFIGGKLYVPAYEPSYDETGVASWYGPGFHGKSTANGETFDTHDLTAAHPTLPMPSLVRVTNLETGKSLVVRVNDRGPFSSSRIIDLSRNSAQRLGITGLAKVRVQYLKEETDEYLAERRDGRKIDMVAYNEMLDRQANSPMLMASTPSTQAEIVEASNNSSELGEESSAAAPLTSISSSDLPKPQLGLISEAHADEMHISAPNRIKAKEPLPNRYGKEVVLKIGDTAAPPGRVNKPVDVAGYYIQAGAFGNKGNAEKLHKKIASVGNISLAKVEVNNGYWWRVRAGPFTDEQAANAALEKVRELGAEGAKIIRQ